MKRIKEKVIMATIIFFVVIIIGYISYTGYISFRDTIVEQQQQHLMTIARSVKDNMQRYIKMKVIDLQILALLPFDEQTLEKLAVEGNWSYIYFVEPSGSLKISFPKDSKLAFEQLQERQNILKKVNVNQTGYISEVDFDESGKININCIEPVFLDDELKGYLIAGIDIHEMYEEIVKPVRAGDEGYAMVKSDDGIIIMHPVPEQIGYDVIDTRREVYPELDYRELEELIDRQLKGEEGTAIYHSYWWTHEKLEKTKKLSAFTPMYLDDNKFWIIAVVMSYEEIQEPINRYLLILISIAIVLIYVFSLTTYLVIKMKRNTEAYEVEMAYLKKMNESAESLRTKEIELEHSRKLRTIGALTSGISHDFNNLLTPILGHSEFILTHLDANQPYYDSVNDIYLSSLKAKELIEHILVFSHLDTANHEQMPLKLSNVILDALNFIKPIISSNIKITSTVEASKKFIMANETEMSQIILNLFTNAIYAMKDSGGQLKVQLSEEENQDDSYAILTVKDTGCGMDEETMSKMYDPFFTSKPAGEGTGLGLLLVQSIVEKYKGKINVKSAPGVGTIFELRFQLAGEILEEVVEVNNTAPVGQEKILLIDDNAAIVKVLTQGLKTLSYPVTGFTDSIKGFSHFCAHKLEYPVIILDESMPNLTGSEFAKKVKELNPLVKIVLITAHKKKAVDLAMKSMDIDVCMMKPLTAKDIAKEIRVLMENSYDV